LEKKRESSLLTALDAGAYFYFAHSFAALDRNALAAATCSHGAEFTAVIEQQKYLCRTIFIPKKSGTPELAFCRIS